MAISICDISDGFVSRSARHSRARVRATPAYSQHNRAGHYAQDCDLPPWKKFPGKKAGVDFGDCNNPEFLRESSAVIRTDLEYAEMVKYVDNSWHALKIVFANEIGDLYKSLGLDAHVA
jgi:hypothetical protein